MTPLRKSCTLLCALTILPLLWGEAFADTSADACKGALDGDAASFASACTETAVRDPYKFAWLVLARICNLGSLKTPACTWQSWATFAETYPAAPAPLQSRPQWPGSGGEYPPTEVTDCTVGGKVRSGQYKSLDPDRPADPCQRIYDFRFNKEAFDYIVENGLWYQEGLADFWKKNEPVDFPPGALSLQAGWKEIDESQKADFHWVDSRDADGEPVVCGLIGIDIKSKILPMWFWISFEHIENPGRCDVIGCRDDFGQRPEYTPPHLTLGETYEPPEAPTEALELLLPASQNSPWKNYRLKGVLTNFVEPDGRPTFLANSAPQIEGVFFPAAPSCIACHARARFDDQGNADLDMSGGLASAFPVVYGAPDPGWLHDNVGTPLPWQQKYRQSNFIWSIPLYTCPRMPTAGE